MSDSDRPGGFTFGKHERLSSKKDIESLFASGKYSKAYPLAFRFLSKEQLSNSQVLISVPKKKFKRAVDRNLLKRRIRESYRLNKHILAEAGKSNYLIAIIYLSDEIQPYKELEGKLILLLNRLIESTES